MSVLKNNWIRLSAVTAVVMFGVFVLAGLSVFKALALLLHSGAAVGGCLSLGACLRIYQARSALESAVVSAENRDYVRARELVLVSVRFNRPLQELREVKELYELIVAVDRPVDAAERIRELHSTIPKAALVPSKFLDGLVFALFLAVLFGAVVIARVIEVR